MCVWANAPIKYCSTNAYCVCWKRKKKCNKAKKWHIIIPHYWGVIVTEGTAEGIWCIRDLIWLDCQEWAILSRMESSGWWGGFRNKGDSWCHSEIKGILLSCTLPTVITNTYDSSAVHKIRYFEKCLSAFFFFLHFGNRFLHQHLE